MKFINLTNNNVGGDRRLPREHFRADEDPDLGDDLQHRRQEAVLLPAGWHQVGAQDQEAEDLLALQQKNIIE